MLSYRSSITIHSGQTLQGEAVLSVHAHCSLFGVHLWGLTSLWERFFKCTPRRLPRDQPLSNMEEQAVPAEWKAVFFYAREATLTVFDILHNSYHRYTQLVTQKVAWSQNCPHFKPLNCVMESEKLTLCEHLFNKMVYYRV